MVSLLRACAFIPNPMFVIASVMSLLVGAEAWEPLWWFFRESAPLFLELPFWVMLPSILLALVAVLARVLARWFLTWWNTVPMVYLPQMHRGLRYFRQVTVSVVSSQINGTSAVLGQRSYSPLPHPLLRKPFPPLSA